MSRTDQMVISLRLQYQEKIEYLKTKIKHQEQEIKLLNEILDTMTHGKEYDD